MVYDHPELGMIAYHPGMWMVHLTCILCVKFLLRMIVTILNDRFPSWDVDGLSQPSFCVKFLLRMVVTILWPYFIWYDHPVIAVGYHTLYGMTIL